MADDARLQIVLEAKIDKLTERLGEANRQVSRSAGKMQHDIEEVNSKWERLFLGEGPGKAIERVFSRSRLAVLEEGSAKIPLFGSALEALGPAGIAAAAGVAAVGVAFEQTRKALEYADDIDRVSKSLGISTTALQEFDSAAIATSVGQEKSREALSQFNEVFNKYASGLASAKQGKFLNALGFTPESARQVTDIGDAVQKTLLKLAALPNQGQRASLAAQLGLSGFNVVLGEGTEGVEKFIAKMREAQANGEIISPAQIARAAELNDQIESLQHRIGQDLKQAFIDLGPDVEFAFEKLEHFTSQLAHLIGQVPDAVRGIADIAAALSHLPGVGKGGLLDLSDFKRLQDQGAANDAAYAKRVHDGQHPIAAFINDVATYDLRNAPQDLARRGRAAALRLPDDPRTLADQLKAAGRDAEPIDRRITDLSRFNTTKAPRAKAGPEDQTASFDAQAQEAASQAAADLAGAQKELTKDIEARAALERAAVDATTDKRLAGLAAEEARIRASKNDAHKAQQLAAVETAAADVRAAAVAKKTLIDRQAADAAIAADRAQRDIEASLRDRHVSAAGVLVTSAQDRAKLELDAFHERLNDALAAFKAEQDQALRDGAIDQPTHDANIAGFRRQNQEDLVAERTRQQRAINPLYDRAHPTTTVADDLQGIEARGLDGLTDSLSRLVTGATDAKTAFHDLIGSVIADLARLAIQRGIEGPLANLLFGGSKTNSLGNLNAGGGSVDIGALIAAIPHFASGGVVGGAGGPTSDNVLAALSPGELVLSNSTLAGLRGLDPARLGRAGGGANLTINVDAGGAFSFAHVAAAVEGGVRRAAATSGIQIASVQRRQALSQRGDLSRF